MKKVLYVITLAAVAAVVCTKSSNNIPSTDFDEYSLLVIGGTGSGLYAPGTSVMISANDSSSAGRYFDHWGGPDSSLAAPLTGSVVTLTMPSRLVTLRAMYRSTSTNPKALSLYVYGGSGAGKFDSGQSAAIIANDSSWSGKKFDRWVSSDSAHIANVFDSVTTIVVTKPYITVQAIYHAVLYPLSVAGASGSGSYVFDSIIIITANDSCESGKSFNHWSGPDSALIKSRTLTSGTIAMPARGVSISAVYDAAFRLTVISGSASGCFPAGKSVRILANDSAAAKKRFDHWGGADSTLAQNGANSSTTIVMPEHSVVLRAIFAANAVRLTVVAGSGGGDYAPYARVAIRADDSSEAGRGFDHWGGPDSALVNSPSRATSVTMPLRNVSVKALYNSTQYQLTVTGGSGSGSYVNGKKIRITPDDSSAQNRIFAHWAGSDSSAVDSAFNPTAFLIMPAKNAAIASVYGSRISSVSAAGSVTMILKKDGTLWACGSNFRGTFGAGLANTIPVPQKVMDQVIAASTGGSFSMLVKNDGTLWCTGSNSEGEFGNGTTFDYTTTWTQTFEGAASCAAGHTHSMVIKNDASLWSSGYNAYGALGSGGTGIQNRFSHVMDSVSSVCAAIWSSMIIKNDGTLWGCGDNRFGDLGVGDTVSKTSPVLVTDAVKQVSFGFDHVMILKTDGSLLATGRNTEGQFGDGSTMSRKTPVRVATGVSGVAAGGNFTMFVTADNILWASGGNQYGQLGNGAIVSTATPVRVMGDVAEVYAGAFHTLILKLDGSLWAVGNNEAGQLGIGSTQSTSTPKRVQFY